MKLAAHAVILAGGRGTRFWPRSRTRAPKQLLNILGRESMLVQTVRRIAPVFAPGRLWVVTQAEHAAAVRRQLPHLPKSHLLVEPEGRNTAAAIALAAVHLRRKEGDALMGVLPADHVIRKAALYRRIVRAALRLAAERGAMAVLGIPPRGPDTGLGYIERGSGVGRTAGVAAFAVRRFTEKPLLAVARRYIASTRYFWNAGMFFWRVSTYLEALERFLPATAGALGALEPWIGSSSYPSRLRRTYRQLENISVDYSVLEPASRAGSGLHVYVLPAPIGWSDIGSWAAVYELLAKEAGATVSAGPFLSLDAAGNYFWAPDKFVAAVGVHGLVIVETPDALLVCSRGRTQEVGAIVKQLEKQKRRKLL
ncbi:MAG TPA: sugar phosphate nucleotidyltransferase [Candidatus Acidoferrales bacterium]|nr:sugar phosphate nucleotidyltransferase [Candidatus Acidoferrales bacterium]